MTGRSWLVNNATRVGFSIMTLAMLAVPTVTFVYVRHRVELGAQEPAPRLGPLAPGLEQQFARAADGPPRFVVLGYHDIIKRLPAGWAQDGRRVSVSATSFAAHLRMLRLAGYRSVSAADVTGFVNQRAGLPRRAVLIAFDGARWRDWTHADPILEAYGFSATVFIDPATVRGKRGMSLSWLALRAMVKTGRWSVGVAGTRDTVPARSTGARGSALLTREWLRAADRAETAAEFQNRVRALLDRQRRTIVENGLPDPRLFSYPFQPGYPLDPAGFAELNSAVTAGFAGALLSLDQDEAVDAGWAARRVLPRLEVYSSTTDELLFNRIQNLAIP